jgi:hypothetical protein
MKRLAAISLFVLCAFNSCITVSAAWAGPNCGTRVPYGTKCFQCAGWANHPSWNAQACNFFNVTTPGFPCPNFKSNKCGDLSIKGPPQKANNLRAM